MDNFNLDILKKSNKKYLFELQKFLDIVDNVEDKDLKERITFQMIKIESVLIDILNEEVSKDK